MAEERRIAQRMRLEEPEAFLGALAQVHEVAAADGRFPHLTAWLREPSGATDEERFALGLDCILDGIAARLPQMAP